MNHQDMISLIQEVETELPRATIDRMLKAHGVIVQGALKQDEEVTLHGIGKLKPVAKPARTGRNPKTGEEIEIPARTAVKFVVAKALKDAVA